MTTIASLVFIISAVSIWYYIKKKPNKRNRNLSIFMLLASFVLIGVTTPNNDSKSSNKNEDIKIPSEKKESYSFTEAEAREFAIYFREHAEIIDLGNKIDFITGADSTHISARIGEAWKEESISRKLYISNELLKEKNKLFNEWLSSKDSSLNSEDYMPKLIVTVSDTNHTTIAQEYNNEMKIINK